MGLKFPEGAVEKQLNDTDYDISRQFQKILYEIDHFTASTVAQDQVKA